MKISYSRKHVNFNFRVGNVVSFITSDVNGDTTHTHLVVRVPGGYATIDMKDGYHFMLEECISDLVEYYKNRDTMFKNLQVFHIDELILRERN